VYLVSSFFFRLDIKDWGSIFKGENSVTPYHKEVVPRTHFFGQSVTSKTIRNPDGVIFLLQNDFFIIFALFSRLKLITL
jgi:hypothetical protein